MLVRTILAIALLPGAVDAEAPPGNRLAPGHPPSAEIQGELIELESDSGRFAAIFFAHRGTKARGAIILLHDQAGNANGLEVIRPLRLGLARAGWDTLSLQLPSASRDERRAAWRSRRKQILSRLQAGLNWLGSREPANRVILAQGDSGSTVLAHALESPPAELKALVLVSAVVDSPAQGTPIPAGDRTPLPVLDIYAQRDYPDVVLNAQARRDLAALDARSKIQQRVVDGATGGFFGLEDDLLARISNWLAKNVTSGEN
jgi:hypothetical protein